MKERAALKYIVPHYSEPAPISWERVFGRQRPLHVEIGFGLGEVLTRQAIDNPDDNFVGCELLWERIFRTLKLIDQHQQEKKPLDNIRILQADARDAFAWLFDEKSIQSVLSLFPCPWPKKGHIKHRLFSHRFLKLLNSRLVPKGRVHIITDEQYYAQWIEREVARTGFVVDHSMVDSQFGTKFERKWRAEGKKHFYQLILIKEKHIARPVTKETPLKAYRLKQFDPSKFTLEKYVNDAAIVPKDVLYDPRKKEMMVYVVVSEEHLAQHFRVTIRQEKEGWRIHKTDGQNFYPTPGLAKALELVYTAAKQSASCS